MKTAPQYVHSNVDAWPIFSLLGPKLVARPPPEWTSQNAFAKGVGGSEVAAAIILCILVAVRGRTSKNRRRPVLRHHDLWVWPFARHFPSYGCSCLLSSPHAAHLPLWR